MYKSQIIFSGTVLVMSTVSACVINTTPSTPSATSSPATITAIFTGEPLKYATPTPTPVISISPSPTISPSPSVSPSPSPSPTPPGKPKPSGSFVVTDATAPNILSTNGIRNQFSYEVGWSGHKASLYFVIGAHTDHLPWKTIRIYWGVGQYSNVETVATNDGTMSNDRTWEYEYTYPSYQLLKGRTLCIEVKDNWDVKRVVCGWFYDGHNNDLSVKYCSGFALDNPASPSALIESVVSLCRAE